MRWTTVLWMLYPCTLMATSNLSLKTRLSCHLLLGGFSTSCDHTWFMTSHGNPSCQASSYHFWQNHGGLDQSQPTSGEHLAAVDLVEMWWQQEEITCDWQWRTDGSSNHLPSIFWKCLSCFQGWLLRWFSVQHILYGLWMDIWEPRYQKEFRHLTEVYLSIYPICPENTWRKEDVAEKREKRLLMNWFSHHQDTDGQWKMIRFGI